MLCIIMFMQEGVILGAKKLSGIMYKAKIVNKSGN